jgi:hypothetical protein
MPSLTRNVTIFEKSSRTDFQKSPDMTPTRLPLVLLVIPTHQSVKTRTLCTFATISRLVQINHKLHIKTSVKIIILA